MGYAGTYGAVTNYAVSVSGGTSYTIDQRQVGVLWIKDDLDTWDDFSTVYNGLQRSVTALPTNVVAGDEVTFSYSNYSGKNAGNYTTIINGFNSNPDNNYSLPESSMRNKQWTIERRPLGTSWQSGGWGVYDGTAKSLVLLTVTNAVAGEDIALSIAAAAYYHATGESMSGTGFAPASGSIIVKTADGAGEISQAFSAVKAGRYDISIALNSMNNYVLAGQAEAKDRIIERAKIYADFTTTEEGTYLADQGEAVEIRVRPIRRRGARHKGAHNGD